MLPKLGPYMPQHCWLPHTGTWELTALLPAASPAVTTRPSPWGWNHVLEPEEASPEQGAEVEGAGRGGVLRASAS